MGAILFAGWLMAATVLPDTIIELRHGDTVVFSEVSGEIVVETWDRSELSVVGEGGDPRDLVVVREGARVNVQPGERKGRSVEVDVLIRVPAWAGLDIRGRRLDVAVSGTTADVRVRNVTGDIRVSETSGRLVLNSADGQVEVLDARGSVTVTSRGDDVTLRGVRGTVDVRSGSGNVVLEDVESSSVRAETLDGDLTFSGSLARGGTYAFSVHDGDASIAIPESPGVLVRVATFDGEFTSDFPVVLEGYGGGGQFEFTIGDGSARMEIKVFDGEMRLLRRR
ncbi:MAG TPA: DUF4097 family beta strand repeat-containing protein [Longimicrobiales bacterium]|nr:DUF4097 family beta strand repeat-containing protein [Longimicrobiales bacterium]